mmetsp:Transcript_576/g.673  ORF Transcript_576/g.673 Transcript_576/m.673 type:complete len:158 (-) Transcript_576:876-1349(-)|eukprot:CAMPEP_0184030006 /NCGR_PEP_ID=MMETSP0955-20130417/1077_1 /TAXON_ID=627963 /ORGANISM="Aplanochytrium sp, Strain PBS07" /LENGTH=157 /DNA_ID=CAMNT_0026315249 /DNA_START=512 /DNA_END=985 /DNA_ORIENTATION=-
MVMSQLETILSRAKSGDPGSVTVEECLYLTRRMSRKEVPVQCKQVLDSAQKTGFLARRASRVGQAWDLGEGHGRRSMYYEDVQGGAVDNPANSVSVDDAYMQNKTPEQKKKIQALRTRMSARGALNIPGVNPEEVELERMRELHRRESRRAEMRKAI